jgi:hypothetical protein
MLQVSYPVKNAYLAFYSTLNFQTVEWRNSIWKWDIQLKIKLFIWLAMDQKILTWDIYREEVGKDQVNVSFARTIVRI